MSVQWKAGSLSQIKQANISKDQRSNIRIHRIHILLNKVSVMQTTGRGNLAHYVPFHYEIDRPTQIHDILCKCLLKRLIGLATLILEDA